MAWVVVILLIVLLLVFGVGSISNSIAHAREAQATIEVAKVAQTQAVTSMISFMVMAALVLLLAVIVVGLILLGIRLLSRRTSYTIAAKPLQRMRGDTYTTALNEVTQTPQLPAQSLVLEELEPDELSEEIARWISQ